MQININKKIVRYLEQGVARGQTLFAIQGGRRAGKTYNILQWLLLRAWNYGDKIIIATMTQDQGREGAYADCVDILQSWGVLGNYYEIYKQPREIVCKRSNTMSGRQGKLIFKSFADSETAKGGACDWIFVNEGNKFSKQQYLDLSVNARKGVIVDYNPNEHFWIDDYVSSDDVLLVTWQDNRQHLTVTQLQWFDDLKAKATAPTATDIDRYYYNVYYLGLYSEMGGDIFNKSNIHVIDTPPASYDNIVLFCDPSALRGADWFACVIAGVSEGNCYIMETHSINQGRREEVARWVRSKLVSYDNIRLFVETNGLVGIDFFEFCQNSDLPVEAWYSKANKYDRILAKYETLTNNTYFVNHDGLDEFLEQVYTFNKKCEHDDNIDAVTSAITILNLMQ